MYIDETSIQRARSVAIGYLDLPKERRARMLSSRIGSALSGSTFKISDFVEAMATAYMLQPIRINLTEKPPPSSNLLSIIFDISPFSYFDETRTRIYDLDLDRRKSIISESVLQVDTGQACRPLRFFDFLESESGIEPKFCAFRFGCLEVDLSFPLNAFHVVSRIAPELLCQAAAANSVVSMSIQKQTVYTSPSR